MGQSQGRSRAQTIHRKALGAWREREAVPHYHSRTEWTHCKVPNDYLASRLGKAPPSPMAMKVQESNKTILTPRLSGPHCRYWNQDLITPLPGASPEHREGWTHSPREDLAGTKTRAFRRSTLCPALNVINPRNSLFPS